MRILLLLPCALSLACEGAPARGRFAAPPDTVTINKQRCILPPGMNVDEEAAIQCAEMYIARNGYTDLPPVPDSTQWTGEFLDLGMEGRRNTIRRHAAFVCRGEQIPYMVGFATTSGRELRGVGLAPKASPDTAMYVTMLHQGPPDPANLALHGRCSLRNTKGSP